MTKARSPTGDNPARRHNRLYSVRGLIVVTRIGFPDFGSGWLLPVVIVGIGVALLTQLSHLN